MYNHPIQFYTNLYKTLCQSKKINPTNPKNLTINNQNAHVGLGCTMWLLLDCCFSFSTHSVVMERQIKISVIPSLLHISKTMQLHPLLCMTIIRQKLKFVPRNMPLYLATKRQVKMPKANLACKFQLWKSLQNTLIV